MPLKFVGMRTDTPQTIYLKDYKPYPYALKHIDLNFDIHDDGTVVTATIQIERKENEPLYLHGEDLELLSVKIDGVAFKDYMTDDKGMTIAQAPAAFTLEIVTKIYPEKNTRLEGLYKSGGNYCTQCEAEGFRRITYYPDRPDVMTTFTTRIEADKKYPVLLSNGNKTDEGQKGDRHFTVWKDPFPKPCYLFALVAGDLQQIHDTYKTGSGRKVDLYIYVRKGDEDQCAHAMESLKKSMKWDEDVYGLEYDLDLFNIVAVSDFNMGAMENKSLNIFNTALVLAKQETATDGDYLRIESVIAHEYFHNWSGDRVTCRDWFQLSLKEGLTVFRDQEFSADLNSRAVQRIDDVAHLRRLQFPEDAGPLAHPIRPDNYIEINNFYTMTVYEKGAEVIRMMRTLIGEETYRKATDLYFSRHDGHAATCEDFVKCMEEASGKDLSQFRLWYSQAGTPDLTAKGTYDEKAKTYTLELTQSVPATPGQPDKKPMHMPINVGLVSNNGHDMDLGGVATKTLELTKETESFVFKNIPSKPVPSILRNFSAPVKLKTDLTDKDFAFLMVHDSDGFNRWEAGQNLSLAVLNRMIDGGGIDEEYIANYTALVQQALRPDSDKALMARALSLPEVGIIGQQRDSVDPGKIFNAREKLLTAIYLAAHEDLHTLYMQNRTAGAFSITPEAMGKRSLQNTALSLLSYGPDAAELAKKQYDSANNMTDRVAALSVLADIEGKERAEAFGDYYDRFKDYQLVVDKWFSLQANAIRPDIVSSLKALRDHPEFNIRNPNRVRSLYGAFAMNNLVCFHAPDGSGYAFLRDAIIDLNTINPQIAARMLTPFKEWKRYTPDRQEKMKAALQKILEQPKLSPDVFEIVSKSLH